ncbi:RNA-directed DNA polymerase [Marasmitruncus massiliensis]|uniref:RNA-directed DNA polymerase n=1 Tax=Marasmitruncus massiliensis TaxID=1944642 RepID=UPI000C79F165|nr:RNA-directed DNA polymerase [Marasmitruncus massiliensis]
MKRMGYLYEKIYSEENISAAIKRASKRKKKRKMVRWVLDHQEYCVGEIKQMLETQNYTPSPMRKRTILDGITGKERIISIPKFYPDQIIQWAILLQIKPILSRGMSDFTCASIPKRGISYGQRFVERWMKNRKATKYCAQMDVRHFYPSVNHDRLKAMLLRKCKDQKLLCLLNRVIDAEPGLPIGTILSQWLANFYLQGIDHYIKEQLHIRRYIRYMDDMILFGSNKKQLHKAVREISAELEGIGLTLKGNWQVYKVDSRGVSFLGYRFFHDRTILRRSNMLRISRKARRTAKRGTWGRRNCAAILSYLGWIKHSDSYHFYQERVKPFVSIKRIKGVIRRENYKHRHAADPV